MAMASNGVLASRLATLATSTVLLGCLGACGTGVDAGVRADSTFPTEMKITCADGSASVSTATVAALRDGVHVQVENTTGAPIEMYLAGASELVAAPLGRSEHVVAAPPGDELSFACGPEGEQGGAQIVDPNGFYRTTSLDCDDQYFGGSGDLVRLGDASEDPVRALSLPDANAIHGLRPRDSFVRLGYPSGSPTVLRVLVQRAGRSVAILDLSIMEGEWYFEGYEAMCGSLS